MREIRKPALFWLGPERGSARARAVRGAAALGTGSSRLPVAAVRARGYITRHVGHLRHRLVAAVALALIGLREATPAGAGHHPGPRGGHPRHRVRRRHRGRLAWRRPVGRAGPGRRAPPRSPILARTRSGALGGRGAEEIRNPSTLFRAGDTLYVGDWGLRRTTLWTLDGQRDRRHSRHPMSLRGALPRARDAAGRFYYEISPRPGPDGLGNRDSAAVVRATPGSTRADTLARLAPVDLAEIVGDAGRRFERRVFSGSDRWGALADGSVWVARVYENRVDWRDPDGEWHRGEPLPDRVLEVTRYDRELFLRKFPPELRNTAEQLPFAAIKPPFEAALTGASRRGVAREKPCSRGLQPPVSCGGPAGAAAARDPGAGTGSYHRRGRHRPGRPSRPGTAPTCCAMQFRQRPRRREARPSRSLSARPEE